MCICMRAVCRGLRSEGLVPSSHGTKREVCDVRDGEREGYLAACGHVVSGDHVLRCVDCVVSCGGVQNGVFLAVLYYVAFCLVDIWRWNFDGVGVLPQAVSGLGSS